MERWKFTKVENNNIKVELFGLDNFTDDEAKNFVKELDYIYFRIKDRRLKLDQIRNKMSKNLENPNKIFNFVVENK